MEKIIIKSEPEIVKKISQNWIFKKISNKKWSEAQIDAFVEKDILGKLYKEDIVFQKKTGVKNIDSHIPSKDSTEGIGEIDVMIFNYFSDQNIDMIVENKITSISADTAVSEAKLYADGKNQQYRTRVVLGYNGQEAVLKVRVKENWQDLYINGKKINGFIGPEILKLIYQYPDYNIFEFDISSFTQKEFHKILESLRIIYRNISGLLADNENARIDFTIAYVALKMITEKERIEYQGSSYGWEDFNKPANIAAAVDAVKKSDRYVRYKDIFTIVYNRKTNKASFDFAETVAEIDVDTIKKIHHEISRIPKMHALPIDLFGEVYEVLASKKTKKDLGEFFTRRHIIRPFLDLEFSYPSVQEQKKVVLLCNNIDTLKNKIYNLDERMRRLDSRIIYSEAVFQKSAGAIFDMKGGNSGLTEEFIYNNQPTDKKDALIVFSSSTDTATNMGIVSGNAKIKGEGIKRFKGPAIIIARNGQAGKTIFIEEGEFTINDHAYVLTVKDAYKERIDLEWFSYVCEKYTKNCVTLKDSNGTFSKEIFLKGNISVIDYTVQKQIVDEKKRLRVLHSKLKKFISILNGEEQSIYLEAMAGGY